MWRLVTLFERNVITQGTPGGEIDMQTVLSWLERGRGSLLGLYSWAVGNF
jgi:hypothetical protein